MSPLRPPLHCGPTDPGVWATCQDQCRTAPAGPAGTPSSEKGTQTPGSEPYGTFLEHLASHGAQGVSLRLHCPPPSLLEYWIPPPPPAGVFIPPLPAGA